MWRPVKNLSLLAFLLFCLAINLLLFDASLNVLKVRFKGVYFVASEGCVV
jgi:hypothetical protein